MADSDFYRRLISARRAAGLSDKQVDIARELGIKPPSVFRWKAGTQNIRLEHALQLAYSAGVTLDWLITGRGTRQAQPSNRSLEELLEIFEELPDETRAEVLAFAKFRSDG